MQFQNHNPGPTPPDSLPLLDASKAAVTALVESLLAAGISDGVFVVVTFRADVENPSESVQLASNMPAERVREFMSIMSRHGQDPDQSVIVVPHGLEH